MKFCSVQYVAIQRRKLHRKALIKYESAYFPTKCQSAFPPLLSSHPQAVPVDTPSVGLNRNDTRTQKVEMISVSVAVSSTVVSSSLVSGWQEESLEELSLENDESDVLSGENRKDEEGAEDNDEDRGDEGAKGDHAPAPSRRFSGKDAKLDEKGQVAETAGRRGHPGGGASVYTARDPSGDGGAALVKDPSGSA